MKKDMKILALVLIGFWVGVLFVVGSVMYIGSSNNCAVGSLEFGEEFVATKFGEPGRKVGVFSLSCYRQWTERGAYKAYFWTL